MFPVRTRTFSRGSARPWRPGFSLIELIIVILVIGILAVAAAPRWTWLLTRYRADAAAQRVVADLTRAQSTAYTSSSPRTISFNVAQNQYQIVGQKDLDRASQTYTVKLAGDPYFAKLISANFGGSSQVSFDGYGQPSVGGGIVVIAAGSEQRTIKVDAATGKASIQ